MKRRGAGFQWRGEEQASSRPSHRPSHHPNPRTLPTHLEQLPERVAGLVVDGEGGGDAVGIGGGLHALDLRLALQAEEDGGEARGRKAIGISNARASEAGLHEAALASLPPSAHAALPTWLPKESPCR